MDLDIPGVGACQWVSEAHEPASHWYVTQTPSGPAFVFVKTRKGVLDWWAWTGQQDCNWTSFDNDGPPAESIAHVIRERLTPAV